MSTITRFRPKRPAADMEGNGEFDFWVKILEDVLRFFAEFWRKWFVVRRRLGTSRKQRTKERTFTSSSSVGFTTSCMHGLIGSKITTYNYRISTTTNWVDVLNGQIIKESIYWNRPSDRSAKNMQFNMNWTKSLHKIQLNPYTQFISPKVTSELECIEQLNFKQSQVELYPREQLIEDWYTEQAKLNNYFIQQSKTYILEQL